jgi:ATP synthase protein I
VYKYVQVCISYVIGALGGLVYVRLLSRSVDGVGGGQGVVGGVASAVGNQRLLIPIILALGYNR